MCVAKTRLPSIASEDVVTTISRSDELLKNMQVEESYKGPKMEEETSSDGRRQGKITQKYIDEMREWFRDGKTICRRHAWHIVVGAHSVLSKEASLVEVTIPEGEVADVIGDTHGQFFECVDPGR